MGPLPVAVATAKFVDTEPEHALDLRLPTCPIPGHVQTVHAGIPCEMAGFPWPVLPVACRETEEV